MISLENSLPSRATTILSNLRFVTSGFDMVHLARESQKRRKQQQQPGMRQSQENCCKNVYSKQTCSFQGETDDTVCF